MGKKLYAVHFTHVVDEDISTLMGCHGVNLIHIPTHIHVYLYSYSFKKYVIYSLFNNCPFINNFINLETLIYINL